MDDSEDEIKRKISKAYCPEKIIENNPILEYCKYIVFECFKSFKIERAKKFGGDIEFNNYQELEISFKKGELHPQDLKNAVGVYLDKLIRPVREHFQKNKKAKQLYELVRKQEVTR